MKKITSLLLSLFIVLNALLTNGVTLLANDDAFNYGYIGVNVDDSKFVVKEKTSKFQSLKDQPLPSYFSLKDLGKVTSVKNQGNYGTCWAHSIIASAESTSIMQQEEDVNFNLSELGVAYYTYNTQNLSDKLNLITEDYSYSDDNAGNNLFVNGGNTYIATFGLASGFGFYKDEKMPYTWLPSASSNFNRSNFEKKFDKDALGYNGDYYLVGANFYSITDTTTIKKALMEKGAMTISYYHNSSYLASDGCSYFNGLTQSSNHAVTLVGWDDNYSASKFKSKPAGDGAWLVKNSWGTTSGDKGYLWISYYDVSIKTANLVQFDIEKTDPDMYIYQYDGTFAINDMNMGSTTYYQGNIYTSNRDELLNRVGFFINYANTDYTIYIYKNVTTTPSSGELVYSQSGTGTYSGYLTVVLDQPVELNENDKFSIVIKKVSTSSYDYYDVTDTTNWYKSHSVSSTGQSFYSTNGTSWTDASNNKGRTMRIKGYTEPNDSINVYWGIDSDGALTISQNVLKDTQMAYQSGMFEKTVKFSDSYMPEYTQYASNINKVVFVRCGSMHNTSYYLKNLSNVSIVDMRGITSNITSMDNMFVNCTNLKTILVNDSYSNKVTNKDEVVFEGCTKLVGCNGTAYNIDNVSANYANIDKGEGYFTSNTLTVSFDDGTSQKVVYGNTVNKPNNPTKTGYKFISWQYNNQDFDFTTLIKKNYNLTSKWELVKYQINYDLDGGINNSNNPAYFTIEDEVSLLSPTKSGYNFLGWYTNKTNIIVTTIYTGQIEKIEKGTTKDITIYAKWEKGNANYTVEHYLQNIDGTYPDTATETETRSYKTDETVQVNTKSYTGFTSPSKKSVTVSADGSSLVQYYYTRNSYTLTVNKGKGIDSCIETSTYKYQQQVDIQATLLPGYKDVTASSGTSFTMPANDVTIEVSATPITYKIQYNLNGGTNGNNPTEYNIETETFILDKPVKQGCIFTSWYLDSQYKTSVTSIEKGNIGDLNLYAKWRYKADINNDSKVTDADATHLLMSLFFPDDYKVDNSLADYNSDGQITDADATYLLMSIYFPNDYPIK